MICFPYMIHYVCKVAGTMSFYKCNGTTNLRSLLALYHKVGTINTYHLFNTNDMFIYFLIRRRDPGLSNTLLGQMLNKRYIPIDYGYPHATLIHLLRSFIRFSHRRNLCSEHAFRSMPGFHPPSICTIS